MTLGELIKFLDRYKHQREVILPMGFNSPHSYRGFYDELAFEPATDIRIGEMLDHAHHALGKAFTGYKGGEFVMTEGTDIWLSEKGCVSEETIGPLLLRLMFSVIEEDDAP